MVQAPASTKDDLRAATDAAKSHFRDNPDCEEVFIHLLTEPAIDGLPINLQVPGAVLAGVTAMRTRTFRFTHRFKCTHQGVAAMRGLSELVKVPVRYPSGYNPAS